MASRNFLIKASQFPDPPQEKTALFRELAGGLNLLELEHRLDADESARMENLWWRDGVLASRDGQIYRWEQALGQGFSCCDRLFWGHGVLHIGDGIYAGIPGSQMELKKLCGGVPQVRGSFIRYQDALLYKTRGCFKKIFWTGTELAAEDVVPYVPVTVINCSPDGSGDLYQLENRLSPQKTVWYNAAVEIRAYAAYSNSTSSEFHVKTSDNEPILKVEQVYRENALMDPSEYQVTPNGEYLDVYIGNTGGEGVLFTILYSVGIRVFHLPVQEVDSIDKILLYDEAVTKYTVDLEAGTITFPVAPELQDPPVNNILQITYSKANEDAKKSIMDCCYGCSYGGTGGAVLVLAGSLEQPNACFWNGSATAMDPGYFPMDYYNLVGDSLEAVMGFGQQAGYLVVLKERSVGRCQLGIQTIEDRAYLTLNYTPIHAALGCDLPWTVQTVENNLIWCSTYAGICRLEDTTAALENQVRCISRKINGGLDRPGLLDLVGRAQTVCSVNDGARYWIAADGAVFLWDYALSAASNPTWFYFTQVGAVAFFRDDGAVDGADLPHSGLCRLFHLDGQGRITQFVRTYQDYGGPIPKVYRFAIRDFDSYERLKHVVRVRMVVCADTDSEIAVSYLTDQGSRQDRTSIRCRKSADRKRTVCVALRKPNCRHVHQFALQLENNTAGADLAIVSAEITARLLGRVR